MVTKPSQVHTAIGCTRDELGKCSTFFASSLSGNSSYVVTEANGGVWEWNDFDASDAQLTSHPDYNTAVESIIAGCKALYLEHHNIDECDVSRTYEGERIVAFRLSRDTDGSQHGDDETFAAGEYRLARKLGL